MIKSILDVVNLKTRRQKANKRESSKTRNEKQLIAFTEQQTFLYKTDIATWRSGIEDAIDIYQPNYATLMDVYRDVHKDAFLKGKVQTRMLNVLNTPFHVVHTETAEQEEVATRLLNKQWFYKYIGYLLESIMWGFSVMELHVGMDGLVKDVKLLPRAHCVPQWDAVMPDLNSTELLYLGDKGYRQNYIQVGEIDSKQYTDIGIYDVVTPWVILKKHSRAFWSQFQELFGMPYRYAEYGGKDESVKNVIYQNLAKMGTAGFGVFPSGVNLEFKEASKTDSFQIFLNAITQANEEISQAVLGVPASQSHEGSYARDKVSYEKESDISFADMRFVQFHVNDVLLPHLTKYFGYDFGGMEFRFNPTWALPIADSQLAVDTWLSQHYDIEEKYIKDTYGVDVVKKGEAQL